MLTIEVTCMVTDRVTFKVTLLKVQRVSQCSNLTNAIKTEFDFVNCVSFECRDRESALNPTPYSTDDGKLAYTEVSHLIEATFRCGPPSLMHLCMTKVLLHGVSLDQSPQVVREMSQGLYNKNNPPANITEEGKEVLKRLAAAYDKHFDDEEEEEEEGVEEEETDGEDAVDQSSDEDSGL